ncbi:HEAT repeat-containing protein 5B [Phytophthora ramorum]|uniref:HEAT repeat-containing protein 5B n=1 Tax=Phytophthora ramorum TaxID=164328 RepID=UPI0030A56338|nr:HEAT repeat-containing protein 5B [Phytophthora ramorum]
MKGAARRLAAAVEAMRVGGGSDQTQQRELVQALVALQRLWKPQLLASASPPKKRSAKSNAALFQLLLAALVVYNGGHTGNLNTAGGAGVTLSASTSESVHRLVCELLVRAFDFSVVSAVNDTLAAKNSPLYVKVSLVMVVCRLPVHEALQFLPDAVALANKNIRAADYYLKQCLIESVAHALQGESRRLAPFHADALKIVSKSCQDKAPEVRIAAAKLLQVVAERTSVATSAGGAGGNQGGGGNGSGAGPSSGGAATGAGNGGGSFTAANGVSLDAILQITAKGMDDASPEARRVYSVVVGTVLAKYATSSGEAEIQVGDNNGGGVGSSRSNEEDAGGRASIDQDTAPSSGGGSGKAKSGFKLHVPGMTTINLPSSLSRRKAATVNFSTIANVVLYFKDMVTTKYLSTNPNQSHGGILASFSIALCGMFERLPPDAIAEPQLREVLDAILAILDHPFALGDLTRARNAVGFVLRYGLNGCLTERQQDVLLGAYLQKLKDEAQAVEPNHHKILSTLVELSHMFHSMGEACVSHARDASDLLQGLLSHEKQSVRFQAAVALSSLVTAIPYRLKTVLTSCLQGLRDTAEYLMRGGSDLEEMRNSEADKTDDGQEEGNDVQSKTHLYAIQGRSAAIAHILRAIKLDAKGGLSQAAMDDIYSISEELVESQFLSECADSIWLTCTRAGWTLVGSLVAMDDKQWIKANLEKLLNLWLKSSVMHSRESSLELLRIEAAVIALNSLLSNSQGIAVDPDNNVYLLASHVLHVYLTATQDTLSHPLKRRGQIARYRLMGWIVNCFSMLPPIFSDSYIVLLDLIAEFTTAQALTNLRHSSLVPAKSTYLLSVLSPEDSALDMVTLSRLVAGDNPSPLYSRELNHALGLQQRENALTDTELEVQYLDTFWRSISEREVEDGVRRRGVCSPFTYVRLVDASVLLFGRLFHSIPEDLQLRCLQHYAGALTDVRVECEVNVCALLFAVIAEARRLEKSGTAPTPTASLSATSWPLQMQTMLCEMISSENAEVRRGAGEALGTLALLLGEDHCKALIIELEKRLVVDKLPQGASNVTYGSNADLDVSVLSAGAAFALACIKRVCGSRISIDTGLIFRFAGECSQPLRTWILHSWSIILESVNSTGGDYEQFVSSTFSLLEAHVLAGFVYSKVNKRGLRWQISTKVALGRIINEVVATLGPELGGSSDRLNDFYSYWMLLRQDGDARVELEFLKFLEQVVVFAPSRFQSADLNYILRIVSDTALLSSATPASLASQHSGSPILSPPSGPGPSLATLSAYGDSFEQNGLVNVGVFTNGWSRSILQNVGLSCIRTLVERDPTLIRRQNLFCLLFSALHVEYNELLWGYLPGLHGMWDVLSFSFADSTTMQRNGIGALQSTALALLDVEGRDHEGAEPCLWALLCRSIAIGESASTFAGAGGGELMMSPKGMNSGIQAAGNSEAAGDDDLSEWSPTPNLDLPKTDASSLASAAAAAQVDTWRATKASVGELIALMPPLSRQVRHFAVECVLRVFELMVSIPPLTTGVYQTKQLHFDLAAARRYFFEVLSAGAALPVSTIGNFLCMYLDEFVTLACHVTTTSAEGDELLMFQCVGARLLNVLVKNFASARDPEVTAGDAYLLDPYRAQLSSATRHALKQVQVESSLSASDKEKDEERYFYAPLLLEAHGVAGACVSAHLIQDKVGLGRILRAVVMPDYGHAHFIGDELTRISLSLANLASVGELLTSSITEAIANKDARDDERRAIATSPLVKAMTNGLSGTTEYLFKCWMDTTFAYGVVMQGCPQWAQLGATSSVSLLSDEVMVMPALQIPLPPVGSAASAPAAASMASKSLRTLYKRYWPKIVNAMAALEVYMPNSVTLVNTIDGSIPKWSSVLLSCAIFHVNTNARDRMEDDTELPAVLRSIPLLLRASAENPLKKSGPSSNSFPVLLTTALNTLMLASKRCAGPAQIEALEAIFSCLSRENLAFAREMCRSAEDGEHLSAVLFDVVAQAGLCPTEVVCQLCDATEQTRHARAVSIGSKGTKSRRSSVASSEDAKHMVEVVQLATTGIVLLHTTEEARSGVVRSVALVQQAICSVAGGYHSPSVKGAVAKLCRASTESVLALARTLEANNDSSDEVLTGIKSTISSSFEFLAEWLKEDIRSAPEFAMQIAANYVANFPVCLQGDAGRFHADVAETTSAILELASAKEDDEATNQQHASYNAELLRGLHAVVKKLVDVHQNSIANRYLVSLGPSLVEIVGTANGYPGTAAELAELDEAEGLLRLLTSQLNDHHGAAFVHMLLPRLAEVLNHQAPSATENVIHAQVPSILARLLLCFAQTHATAFKEAVAAMVPTLRGVLENALRLALTGSASATGSLQSSAPAATKLDLSRFG